MLASLNKPQYYHLWFMYSILGIYLILPLLKILIQHSSQTLQIYFVGLWFVASVFLPFFNHFHFIKLYVSAHLPMMVGYMGYLVLGYLLAKVTITKKIFFTSLLFVILGSIGTIYGTYYLTEKAGKFVGYFHGNFGLFTFILAVAYFLVLKYIAEHLLTQQHRVSQIITLLSASSLGIYLVHPIYLRILNKLGINVFAGPAYIMVPTVALIAFVLSFVTIYLIQKIPVIKQIAP